MDDIAAVTRDQDGSETGGVFRSAAMRLTVGLWTFSFISFAISLTIGGAGYFPFWMVIWLGVITITGLAFTAVLYGAVKTVRTRPAGWRWAALSIAALCAAVLQAVVDGASKEALRLAFGLPSQVWLHMGEFAFNSLLYMWLFGFYTAALELISATERAAANARRAAAYALQIARERELAREAQVQMLRFQLNPHFLFNTLNSISSLVVSGRPALAEAMISRLSQFMRASLNPREEVLIPLSQELNAVEAYLDIEAVRFSDALNAEIDCPPGLEDVLVPSMILQPLVENAVKYALTPSDGTGSMRVRVRQEDGRLEISVSDDGALHAQETESGTGIGLENVRRRLEVVYGDLASLDTARAADGFHATMSVPLRRSAILSAA